eukprot:scaffold3087_cov288-Chaetoceros_neogracile.AAC.2
MKTVHFGNVDGVNNDERKLLSVELPAPAPAIVAKPNHEPLVAKPNHEPPEDNLNEKKIKTLLSFATVTGMKTSPIKRFDTRVEQPPQDPISKAQQVIIAKTKPTTELEIALAAELERNKCLIANVTNELNKIKQFISKRKQTYKRKRKDGGAPKRALSAYNIYIKEKFKILAQENQDALTDANTEKALQRIKPENLVARTGNEWKKLSSEEKQKYEEKAKADKKRYKDEVASYNPPEPIPNKRRNKTGYNVFFTAHVNRVKENDTRLPSERGSVARMVGNAWKELGPDERRFFELEAEKANEAANSDHEVKAGDGDGDKKKIEDKRPPPADFLPVPHMIMPPHAAIGHQPGQHGPRGPYPPPPPGFYPYPYDYYPPMPMPYPPPGKGEQGRHPGAHHPYPFPPHPYPPHPYHHPEHHAAAHGPPRVPSPEL